MLRARFYSMKLSQPVEDLIKKARDEFMLHHPEMDGIRISKNKVLLEALKFYVEND